MRKLLPILVILLVGNNRSWGDLVCPVLAHVELPVWAVESGSEPACPSSLAASVCAELLSPPGAGPKPYRFEWPVGDGSTTDQATIQELPPPPRADALCLVGVLTIGAWQLARRVQSTWGELSDWYFVGGQDRMGHTTAFDLQFNPIPALLDALLAPEGPTLPGFFISTDDDRNTSEPLGLAVFPRAPPLW